MRLSRSQLADLLGVLDKIDRGGIRPRVGDRIGRFLRQYEAGRRSVRAVLAQHSVACRDDGAVTGKSLGVAQIACLIEPEVDELAFPLGEIASTLVVSEELGGVLNVRMWLKAHSALAAFKTLRQTSALRLVGDYRWTPLAQLTPGAAEIEPPERLLSWAQARCLKTVADDLLRPPHALEYVLDFRLGPPGLKCFRTMCAIKEKGMWRALPCFGCPRSFNVSDTTFSDNIASDELLLLLVYREPWSSDWTIVRTSPIQPADALAHAVTWAHFRSELTSDGFSAADITAARESLREWGVKTDDFGTTDLVEQLVAPAKVLLRSVRGTG